jgi:hypothetical protein
MLSALLGEVQPAAAQSKVVSPETLLGSYRELVRWKWALYARRPCRSRSGQSAEHQDLILREPGMGISADPGRASY